MFPGKQRYLQILHRRCSSGLQLLTPLLLLLLFVAVLSAQSLTTATAVLSLNTGQNCDGSLAYNFTFQQNKLCGVQLATAQQ